MVTTQGECAGVPADETGNPTIRRHWQTPRVIVSEMAGAQHALNAFITDHTQFGGSSSGTLNS